MDIPNNLDELTELFAKLGARDPMGWARSQLDEGMPQLQKYLFLRQAWKNVLREDDTDWIQREVQRAQQHPDEPYAGIGHALQRCLDKGVRPQDLTDIVRGFQARSLFDFGYLLDDPAFSEREFKDFAWGLFEVDKKNGNPIPPCIDGLYECVLDTDPTGREMRPRNAS